VAEIPFLDLGQGYLELKAEIDAAVSKVLAGGRYILGDEVESFEREFSDYLGTGHVIGVGNGLDGLALALLAAGIGPGDEVLVPANTFIATFLAVSRAGALPVPVEPRPETFTIDPDKAGAAITPRTRAIIPVHLYGQPADMDPVLELADRHSLFVLEDAAQAHGATYKGRRVGTLGHAAAWSFYPGKNLGGLGDGGAVSTSDAQLARRVRLLGNYGSEQKYIHRIKGWNSRLDELQAAVLRVKLSRLDWWNARRKTIAAIYSSGLAGTGIILPTVPDWADPVWHLYVIRTGRRDALIDHLAGQGIRTLIHYPLPVHLQDAYLDPSCSRPSFPVTERLAREILSLPMGPHLDPAQAETVVAQIRLFFSSNTG
jgi:dTDP-4-amino-4,6-dideoxygalactose transaminase